MNNEFEFYFSLDEENDQRHYEFVKHTFDVISLDEHGDEVKKDIDEGDHDEFYEFLSDIESEYGVHDIGFAPDDQFFGFTTYEVELDKIDELIAKWKQFFVSLGFEVSNHQTKVGFSKPSPLY